MPCLMRRLVISYANSQQMLFQHKLFTFETAKGRIFYAHTQSNVFTDKWQEGLNVIAPRIIDQTLVQKNKRCTMLLSSYPLKMKLSIIIYLLENRSFNAIFPYIKSVFLFHLTVWISKCWRTRKPYLYNFLTSLEQFCLVFLLF